MITDPKEVMPYLWPLAPRGQGEVRDQHVRGGTAIENGSDLGVTFSHAERGKYTIHLKDIEIERPPVDDDSISLFETGTWSVDELDDGWRITAYRRSILGVRYTIARVSRIEIETHDLDNKPAGACKVCGSTKAKLQLPLCFEADIIGEGEFKWDGINGSFFNFLTQATCADCNTPLPYADMGSLTGKLNGHDLDQNKRHVADLSDLCE